VTKTVLALIGVAILMAACGNPGCACGAELKTPPVVTSPGAGFDVVVTDKDQDVTVHAGQRIEVFLSERPGLTLWSGLRSDDETVLAPIPTGVTAARGVTIGGFKAVAPGTASISAYATAVCSPDEACPMYAALFSVRVTVT
jgi:hypothetical protein